MRDPGRVRGAWVSAPLSAADQVRRRGLVRMKSGATALLLVAAVIYVLARRAGGLWVGFVEAAAEAGMVGGLADWFAVTALFRRPLGLPIPHTAIIPTRKDALGRNLSDFVGTNFLSEQVIRERLRQADVPRRVGAWLRRPGARPPGHHRAGPGPARRRGRAADEDVRAVLEPVVLRRLAALPVGPTLGRLLAQVVEDKAHHRLVDLVATAVDDWLTANREHVVDLVARQAPRHRSSWTGRSRPASTPSWPGSRPRSGPSPSTRSGRRWTGCWPASPTTCGMTRPRSSGPPACSPHCWSRARSGARSGTPISAGCRLLLEMVDDPDGELRTRLAGALSDLGRRLDTDDALRARVDGWVADAAGYVVTHYRDELTRTITDTVERWDGGEPPARSSWRSAGTSSSSASTAPWSAPWPAWPSTPSASC